MRIVTTTFALLSGALIATQVFAQQAPAPLTRANPAAGCTATPAQLEANKKVALTFFQTAGDARVALADPSYKQHNPAFVKGGKEAGLADYEYFKQRFGGAGARQGGGGGAGRAQGAGPQPPPGNPAEVVVAECDIVSVIHKNYRQDPTAAPGTWYEVFTFDTFRVQNGKLTEHWDGAVINPPAPEGGRGQ